MAERTDRRNFLGRALAARRHAAARAAATTCRRSPGSPTSWARSRISPAPPSICSPAAMRWRRNIAKADIAPVFRANGTLNPGTERL